MSVDPSEPWLKSWHDERPGATSRAFQRAKPSSYEWLAAHATPGERVLDLACGDGALLEVLRSRGIDGAIGVDMSEGELGAARTRLGPSANLVRARAQALPFEDGSFDLVTCHLALMLMRPIEEALIEVRRVLRPGGKIAAVVGGGLVEGEHAWTMFVRRLREEPLDGPPIGDRRAYAEEGVRALFDAFEAFHLEKLDLDLSGTPDEVWRFVMETYDASRLSRDRLAALERAARADWSALQRPDGSIPCRIRLLGFSAVRPAV